MKTPATIDGLRHALYSASRRADMTGQSRRSKTLEAHCNKLESLDPMYAQMGGSDPYLTRVRQVVTKARRALRAWNSRGAK